MEFEWDENKHRSNLEKHGIGFDEAIRIFNGPVQTTTDDREDYGEHREISIGEIENLAIVVVVHTDREGITRIISARPAHKKERDMYHEYCTSIIEGR